MNKRQRIIPKNSERVALKKVDCAVGVATNHWKYIIFFLAVCYPLSFGNIGRVADVLWIEWLAPLTFIVLLFKVFNASHSFIPIGGRLSAIAIFILLLFAVAHFIFHPVSSQVLLGAAKNVGGLRAYTRILIGVFVFFCAYWGAAYWQTQEHSWRTILRAIMWISLAIGLARLATYMLGMELPLLKGVFIYDEGAADLGKAYRIGGLTNSATLGIAALLALNINHRWRGTTYVFLAVFLLLMVMGGGRSSMAGVLAALFVYFVLMRREMGKAVVLTLLLVVGVISLLNTDLFSRQFSRIENISGSFEVLQPQRYLVYKEMWRIFLENPVFGKGIGIQFVNMDLPEFVIQQVANGGHGAYFSAISIFGVAGALFLVANLFRPILVGLRRLRSHGKNSLQNPDCRTAATFVVISLVIIALESTVGGNGYSLYRIYLFAGIIGGVFAREHYAR